MRASWTGWRSSETFRRCCGTELLGEILGAELLRDRSGHRRLNVAGMKRFRRLDERDEALFAGRGRGVYWAAIGVRSTDAQRALEYQEHLVLMGVSVPRKLAEDTSDFHVMIIKLTNDTGRPTIRS